MLDFYNELGTAIRGRLQGANTIARVNEPCATSSCTSRSSRTPAIRASPFDGILITPFVRDGDVVRSANLDDLGDGSSTPRRNWGRRCGHLRSSPLIANAQESWLPGSPSALARAHERQPALRRRARSMCAHPGRRTYSATSFAGPWARSGARAGSRARRAAPQRPARGCARVRRSARRRTAARGW
jgi:hypothetical protein